MMVDRGLASAVFQHHSSKGVTEVMEPHAPKSHVIPSPKYYCFPMGQPGQSPLYLLYYSDTIDIVPQRWYTFFGLE